MSQQSYSLLADFTILLHFGFILFAVFGAFLVLHWHRLAWLHVPVFIWASIINIGRWICPLTPMEVQFRRAAGETPYQGGFIDHYIGPIVYPEGLTRNTVILFSLAVFAWNLLIYGYMLYKACKHNTA
jgi:hypothetical protein